MMELQVCQVLCPDESVVDMPNTRDNTCGSFSKCEICRRSRFSGLTIVSVVDVQSSHKMEISTLIGQ
jgi:hypothetical protein